MMVLYFSNFLAATQALASNGAKGASVISNMMYGSLAMNLVM